MRNIDEKLMAYIDDLIERYPVLVNSKEDICRAYQVLEKSYKAGKKLLVCGNGGSAADSDHIVGELMKGFSQTRKIDGSLAVKLQEVDLAYGRRLAEKLQCALPAIALSNHNALNTAYLNDVDGLLCYAQQVMGYGEDEDVLLGITTSGNAKNVLFAAVTAKAKGLRVIGLTGKTGGELAKYADVCVQVNEMETYKVQELHLPIYHCLCRMLEMRFFDRSIRGETKDEKQKW